MNLTPKQEKFCQSYVLLGDKSAAYREAYDVSGMKPETVNRAAFELYENPKITARIEELQKEAAERNRIDIDELVQSMASMVRFDIKDLYDEKGNLLPIPEMPKQARLMIESFDLQEMVADGDVVGVTKKVRTIKKLDAIEKLMKHLGGYEQDNKQKQTPVQPIHFRIIGKDENE